jgi:hypothetical protein
MTDEEKKAIVQDVLNEIQTNSQSVDELEQVTSLDNLTSLPAMKGEKLVAAPLSLLSKPATDAAAEAKESAATATEAATEATDAAKKAEEALSNVYTKTEADNRISEISQIYTTPIWGNSNDNYNTTCIVFDDNVVNVGVVSTITLKVGSKISSISSTPIYLSLRDDTHGEFAKSTNTIVQSENVTKYVTFVFEPFALPTWFRMYFVDASGNSVAFRIACAAKSSTGIKMWGGGSYTDKSCPAVGINVASEIMNTLVAKAENTYTKAETDQLVDKMMQGVESVYAKAWVGTQAEYDALGTYDKNTIYYITK